MRRLTQILRRDAGSRWLATAAACALALLSPSLALGSGPIELRSGHTPSLRIERDPLAYMLVSADAPLELVVNASGDLDLTLRRVLTSPRPQGPRVVLHLNGEKVRVIEQKNPADRVGFTGIPGRPSKPERVRLWIAEPGAVVKVSLKGDSEQLAVGLLFSAKAGADIPLAGLGPKAKGADIPLPGLGPKAKDPAEKSGGTTGGDLPLAGLGPKPAAKGAAAPAPAPVEDDAFLPPPMVSAEETPAEGDAFLPPPMVAAADDDFLPPPMVGAEVAPAAEPEADFLPPPMVVSDAHNADRFLPEEGEAVEVEPEESPATEGGPGVRLAARALSAAAPVGGTAVLLPGLGIEAYLPTQLLGGRLSFGAELLALPAQLSLSTRQGQREPLSLLIAPALAGARFDTALFGRQVFAKVGLGLAFSGAWLPAQDAGVQGLQGAFAAGAGTQLDLGPGALELGLTWLVSAGPLKSDAAQPPLSLSGATSLFALSVGYQLSL